MYSVMGHLNPKAGLRFGVEAYWLGLGFRNQGSGARFQWFGLGASGLGVGS